MGYWGWRTFVFAFISVWITSCTTPSAQAPQLTSTQYPINITSARSPDIKTAQPIRILPLITILPPQSVTGMPENVAIQNLTCHSLPTQYLSCLGIIQNNTHLNITNIALQAQMLQEDNVLFSEIVFPEQTIILPNGVAPFRILLPDYLNDNGFITITIHDYQHNNDTQILYLPFELITIEQVESNQQKNKVYTIQGQVTNPNEFSVNIEKMIVILEDDQQQIVGYRIFQESQLLQPQAEVVFKLEIASQTRGNYPLQPIVTIEAEPVNLNSPLPLPPNLPAIP